MNIVFFDIDGTLAIGRNVPESAEKALREMRENGDLVFICTGRSPSYVKKNFGQYADGFICCNGRLAFMGDEILYDHPLTKEQVDDIVKRLKKVNAGYAFFETNAGYFEGSDEGFALMSGVWDPGFLRRGIPEEMHAYNFDVYFQGLEHRLQIEKELEDICLLNPHGPHPTADVTVLGIDKGTALINIAEKLNIPLENTYAFGDGVNDICMLEAAGHGIAMGNGVDDLKEKAEYITTEILKDGVYLGLKHYGLVK